MSKSPINPQEIANIAEAEESLWWFRGMRGLTFALLDPLMNGIGRVLEAGCGTGHFAAVFQKRYGVPVFTVDLEPEAIRCCRRRGVPYPAQASIASLPFPDRAFDLVLNLDVLPHFPPGQEQAAFAELVRVLRPQGLLLLRTAALEVFRSRHSQYVWERQRFSRGRLQQLARASNLRILRLSYANFFLTPVAFLKFRVWEPLLRQPPASGVQLVPAPLDHLLYLPLAVEKWWIARGGNFPWGQSLVLLAQKN
ncbi:MAG: class I SAM-dependent methyltransferase [Acidobacteria bacterium]|nr:class I SAM-dependent methyltransferase [Acidobacteriota bacterium]